MVAAPEILIPIQCEYYALEGLSQLLNNIALVQSHLNPSLHVSTILLTMYDGRTKLADQVTNEVRNHFGEIVLRTVIPRSVKVSEAPGFGQTVLTYDPGSRGAMSYLDAAREVAAAGGTAAGRAVRDRGAAMTERRGGLGRGLAALIPTGPPTEAEAPGRPGVGSRAADVVIGAPRRGRADESERRVADVPSSRPAVSDEPDAAATVEGGEVAGAVYREIRVDGIRPNPKQPRTAFDEEALAELEHSVREFGLLQPIVVRELAAPEPGVEGGVTVTHELVMGERRWRAAQRAELTHIPAIVRQTSDDTLLRDALLENIHRVQLNPLEEAAAYQQLLTEFDVTHEQLADRIGRSRPAITNTIRLLRLPVAVQRRLAAGVLSAGHARAVLGLDDAGAQEELATRIVAEGLSVRAAEEAVTLARGETPAAPKRAPARKPLRAPGLQDLAERLSDAFDTRVKVELGKRKGRIVVEFGSVDDLERIARLMGRDPSAGPSPQG